MAPVGPEARPNPDWRTNAQHYPSDQRQPTSQSAIEWTDSAWNPVTGCDKLSPGCKFCYAEVMSRRLHAMGQANHVNGFNLTLQPHMRTKPLEWKKPQVIFVNSMSDVFHADVPLDYIQQVFDVMRRARWHEFQVLTKRAKRAERLAELAPLLPWPANVWMGVSVENPNYTNHIDHLRTTGAAVKLLSVEPLLGPIPRLNVSGIDLVIVGGNPGARRGRLKSPGCWTSCANARPPTCRSSSNNGVASTRRPQAANCSAKPGTRCR
jgi:protein gp37